MSKKVFELDFLGKKITVETGELAKQANGSVLVRYEDTVILTAAVMGRTPITQDFFPLTVLYQEKLYSVGKIPGGFIKREGRPTDQATLTARLIDRPIRPMFDENFRNEVQVINTVLSVDQNCSPEMTALLGSSLALTISNIPFDGPVAGVVVGKIGKEYIINPTPEQQEESTIHLTVAGSKDAICMVEAGAKEVSEKDMLGALMFGHEHIKMLCEFQEKIREEIGKEKIEVELAQIDPQLEEDVKAFATDRMYEALSSKKCKLEKYADVDAVKEATIENFAEIYGEEENCDELLGQVKKVVDAIEGNVVRRMVTKDKTRTDGRGMKEIRPLSAMVDLLPRTHGSAVFTRGETQALATTTLGSLEENQILDGLSLEDSKRFMLHYNFPQFSVGEVGRYGSPGRREIGHGALGERALLQVMPDEKEFPYTVRVVSEILESNGSSSQATICAGCLSLMAAGVPIKAPVAGISCGLITGDEGVYGDFMTMVDIQGLEDFYGDMDFKVAGTKNGITAIQMDLKVHGLTPEIIKEAFAKTHKARNYILDEIMLPCISEPRAELSKYAPKMLSTKIDPEKIGDVIGKQGKVIQKIQADCEVKIDIEEDGRVFISGIDIDNAKRALTIVELIAKDPEIGAIYNGVVTRLMSFGAFVEIAPGKEGLVHISRLDVKRTEKVEDVVNVGDTVLVKVLEIDDQGRLNLSRRDALIEVKGLVPENDIDEEPKKRDNNRRFNRRRNND